MMQLREGTLLWEIPKIIAMEKNNNIHRTCSFSWKCPVGNSASTIKSCEEKIEEKVENPLRAPPCTIPSSTG
jgi:hypothetical protein